jgi:hypothetical protein
MPSTKRSFHPLFFLLATTAALNGACTLNFGTSFDLAAAMEDPSDTNGGNGGATSGTVGVGGDGQIPIPTPTPHPPPDGQTSFAHLCGDGCMTGSESLGCGIAMNPDGSSQISCQIVLLNEGASAECLPAGTSKEGEACERVADCAASLGCVLTESGVGVCRPYCCGDIEACQTGSYCSPAVMAEDATSLLPLVIPACLPATPCTPLDDSTCPTGLTCTMVRSDGTTDCVTPGPGEIGDDCPCSAGHVCLKATNKCLKLCHVGGSDCPDGMLCQGGAKGFPDGIGACVQ